MYNMALYQLFHSDDFPLKYNGLQQNMIVKVTFFISCDMLACFACRSYGSNNSRGVGVLEMIQRSAHLHYCGCCV